MSSNVQNKASEFAAYEPTTLPAGPVLIASDSTANSDSAFPLAQVIAAHTNATVKVVSVVRPFASAMYSYDLVPVALENEASVRAGREKAIAEQLHRTIPDLPTWPLVMTAGDTAREITAIANAESARVIMTGRGRHGMFDRMLAGETVLRLLQLGETPVLAVEPGLTRLPSRVVLATDFSEYSLYAARVALSLVAPDATVYLVHVGPSYVSPDGVHREFAEAEQRSAKAKLAELKELLARDEMDIRVIVRGGTAASELLTFANEVQADLIVSSSHGYGFIRRTILGSVASSLVRGASCSVLCVPGSARATAAALARRAPTADTRVLPNASLDRELSSFSDRNQQRHCTVQVYRRDIGAQLLGHDLPLVGATYEEASRTVTIMFGASQVAGQHLTHAIHGVTEVDLASGAEGRDTVLRLVHDDGYTLVELE